MKIEVGKTEFKPITITLETEDELYQMYAAANHMQNGDAFPLFLDIYKKFRELFDESTELFDESTLYSGSQQERWNNYWNNLRSIFK